jgi:uncharacterized RDD family membrane protein YckC
MYCQNCGKLNIEEANFCYACGQPLVKSDRPITTPVQTQVNPVPPAPIYPSYQPQPYYWQGYYYPTYQYPPQNYDPATSPNFLYYHPLGYAARNLPADVFSGPQHFYSLITSDGRLVFLKKAAYGKRFAAGLLDWLLGSLPGIIAAFIYSNGNSRLFGNALAGGGNATWWVTLISTVCFFGYFTLFTALYGKTPGKMLLGLRVVRYDGSKPGWATAFLRQCFGYTVSSAGILLGFIWPAFDKRQQGWHDKLARTFVVEERELVEGRDFSFPPPEQVS